MYQVRHLRGGLIIVISRAAQMRRFRLLTLILDLADFRRLLQACIDRRGVGPKLYNGGMRTMII